MAALPPKLKLKTNQPNLASSFIKKTYELLEDQQFTDIVDWNEDGTALVIKKPQEFAQQVLPTYFKHGNLTSFVRQLNMYDFHKRRTAKYDHVYFHELFHKGKKHLLKDIKRKNQENTLSSLQKAIDALESAKASEKSETNSSNSMEYENQLLKKLNKDALARIVTLENKVRDLTVQNQELWSQITHQNQKEDVLVSIFANTMKRKGIPLDQLSKILSNQVNLPYLDFSNKLDSLPEPQPFEAEKSRVYDAPTSPTNTTTFFNFDQTQNNYLDTPLTSLNSVSTGQFNTQGYIQPSMEYQPYQPMEYEYRNFPNNHIQYPPVTNSYYPPMQDWNFQPRPEASNNNMIYQTPKNKVFDQFEESFDLNFKSIQFQKESDNLGKRKLDYEKECSKSVEKLRKMDGYISPEIKITRSDEEQAFLQKDLVGSFKVHKFDSLGELPPTIDVNSQCQYSKNLDLNDFT